MKNRIYDVLAGGSLPRIVSDRDVPGYSSYTSRINISSNGVATLPDHLRRGGKMKTFVVLYPGEDGYIIAECPSLPGCISQGKNRYEAIENIKEAIELYREVINERGIQEYEVIEVEI